MKRFAYLILILLSTAACQPKPRNYYLIVVSKSDNEIIKGMPSFEYDTIKQANDKDAYINALERFYAVKITDVRLSLPSRPVDFQLLNDGGKDVKSSLGIKATDSLNLLMEGIYNKEVSELHNRNKVSMSCNDLSRVKS